MNSWTIVETNEYREWVNGLSQSERKAVDHRLAYLRLRGHTLGRPYVDHVKGSRYSNMKELRVTGRFALRVLFCFDPKRNAVLLIGGNKASSNDWYDRMISVADELMDEYLREEAKND